MWLSNRIGLLEREDNIVVSTVMVSPYMNWYGMYETAISIDGMPWRIAKGYNTIEEAIEGHIKFSAMSKEELMKYKYIG